MMFSCNFQQQNMFRGADCFLPTRKISSKLCSKGFWDTRIDSQVRLASRLNIKVPYLGLLAYGLTEKFYGHLLPRHLEGVPLVFKLCCQGKDSLGDINGYDPNNNDTHKADKELEARRSKDSVIDKVVDLSMALNDEAARAWIDVNQFFSAIQETSAEESCVKEAVHLATEANRSRNSTFSKGTDQLISLEEEAAHAWNDANQILHVVQEMIIEESAAKEPVQKAVIVLSSGKESSKNEIKEMLENIASLQNLFMCLQIEKYKLIKEANRLSETAKRAQNLVLKAEEEVMEMMIWGKQAMTLECEAIRRLSDAKTALKIAEKSHGEGLVREVIELDEANQELEAIRSRNSMISKAIDQMISLEEEAANARNDANQTIHVLQETIAEESVAKEAVQKVVIALSLGKESSKHEIKKMLENLASLQDKQMCLQIKKYELLKEANRLSEGAKRAHNSALETEEEVIEMMVWGEQALTLEREAIHRLNDAETALKIAEKSHERELDKESTIVDDDVSQQAERKLSVDPSAKRDMPSGASTSPQTGASSS